jgi:hypothetical protein
VNSRVLKNCCCQVIMICGCVNKTRKQAPSCNMTGSLPLYSCGTVNEVLHLHFNLNATLCKPIPEAGRSKGLRPRASWDCGFESRRGHGCMSLVSVVRQRSLRWTVHSFREVLPRVVCLECDREASIMRRSLFIGG